MRMICNSVFVLIAGILTSITVLAQIPGQKGLLQSILEINSAPKSGNFNSSNGRAESIDKLLRESCMKIGGISAYNIAKEGWQNFLNCSKKVDSKEIKEIQFSDFLIALKNHCVNSAIEQKCVEQLSHSIEHCMKPEELLIVSSDSMMNMGLMPLKFICEDEGARIDKFITDGGQKCINSNKKTLLDCFNEFSTRYSPAATEKETLFTRHLDVNDCPNIAKLQLCWFKVFNNCEHHAPADIVDALFNSIKKEINCKNLYTSEASESSVFNVIVITIVMAIFSRF